MEKKAARPIEFSGTLHSITLPGELKLYHNLCENLTPILEMGVSGTMGCDGVVFGSGVSAATA